MRGHDSGKWNLNSMVTGKINFTSKKELFWLVFQLMRIFTIVISGASCLEKFDSNKCMNKRVRFPQNVNNKKDFLKNPLWMVLQPCVYQKAIEKLLKSDQRTIPYPLLQTALRWVRLVSKSFITWRAQIWVRFCLKLRLYE